MKVLTLNATDNAIGGAARIALNLHEYLYGLNSGCKMLVGRKSSELASVVQFRRSVYSRIKSFVLANDIDHFKTDFLLSLVKDMRIDLVHAHNINGWYFNLETLVKISQITPTVWTLHDMWALTPHCGHTNASTLEHGLYKCSDPKLYPTILWDNSKYLSSRKSKLYEVGKFKIVTPCDWLADKVSRTALANKFCCTIPNGIDTKIYKPVSDKKKSNVYEHRIGFVAANPLGNIYKGFNDFLWLAEQYYGINVEFIAVGAQKDSRVGPVKVRRAVSSQRELSQFLSELDVLVVPSSHEVSPLIIMEAIACGTPVVAYNVGGISELLKFTPGCYLVEAGNKQQLVLTLKEMFSNSNNNKVQMSLDLTYFAEQNFAVEKMLNAYYSLYDRLVQEFHE